MVSMSTAKHKSYKQETALRFLLFPLQIPQIFHDGIRTGGRAGGFGFSSSKIFIFSFRPKGLKIPLQSSGQNAR